MPRRFGMAPPRSYSTFSAEDTGCDHDMKSECFSHVHRNGQSTGQTIEDLVEIHWRVALPIAGFGPIAGDKFARFRTNPLQLMPLKVVQ